MINRKSNHSSQQTIWLSVIFLIGFFLLLWAIATGQFKKDGTDDSPTNSIQSQETPHGSLLPGILPDKPAILTSVELQRLGCPKGWRPIPKHPPADVAAAPVPVLSVVTLAYSLWPEQIFTKGHTAAPAQPRAPPFSA